jgi:hypothetical protein
MRRRDIVSTSIENHKKAVENKPNKGEWSSTKRLELQSTARDYRTLLFAHVKQQTELD